MCVNSWELVIMLTQNIEFKTKEKIKLASFHIQIPVLIISRQPETTEINNSS